MKALPRNLHPVASKEQSAVWPSSDPFRDLGIHYLRSQSVNASAYCHRPRAFPFEANVLLRPVTRAAKVFHIGRFIS
jgi:hypothetical protein